MGERAKITTKSPETKRESLVAKTQRTDFSGSISSPIDHILFLQRTIGNQAVQRLFKSGVIQAKLKIGEPDDIYEQEADRVAEQVMRMPDRQHMADSSLRSIADSYPLSALSHTPSAISYTPSMQRQVEEDEEEPIMTKSISSETEVKDDIYTRLNLNRSGGQPLPETDRNFIERRFGVDFSGVRIYTDSNASQMNRELNAEAFTYGKDIYFGAGRYSPHTSLGKRLLAHELTHVVQQRKVIHGSHIQRACGRRAVGPTPPTCNLVSDVPSRERFLFNRGCDDFAPGEQIKLERFARTIPSTASVHILGLASYDGNASFNESLSCHRADQGARVIHAQGRGGNIRSIRATGGVPGTAGNPAYRAVAIEVIGQQPPTIRRPLCGPDATDWFVNQVNRSRTDPAALVIRMLNMRADALARRYGITAHQVAEGGVATMVEVQEARLRITGPPPPLRRGAIVGQLAGGSASRSAVAAALSAAIAADPLHTARIMSDFSTIGNLIHMAGNHWTALVNHGARWDFKAHFMDHPRSRKCPDEECPPGEVGIVTLCPQSNPQNCFESDLPGNFFYALIGKYVGWSELTLQLGSQYAELTDVRLRPARPAVTWDTPEDTAAISLGYRLPLPLTEAALCSAVSSARGRLVRRSQCDNCLDTVPTRFI